ncbi:MAG: head GIN domain-containing protein [Bacteroidota bacterium]
MKRLIISCLLWAGILLSLSTSTAGSSFLRESRDIKDFHSVDIKGNFEVLLKQDKRHALQVEAGSKLMNHITSEVEDGVLVIRMDKKRGNLKKTRLYISSPEYRLIKTSGTVDIWSQDALSGDKLRLHLAGAGDWQLALDYRALNAKLAGAGSMKLRGQVRSAELNLGGAANVMAYELNAQAVEVELKGTGAAKVFAAENLEVSITGLGAVTYEGNPEVYRHITGFGTLRKRASS